MASSVDVGRLGMRPRHIPRPEPLEKDLPSPMLRVRNISETDNGYLKGTESARHEGEP